MTSHFSTGVFVGLSPVEKPQAPCKKERKRKKGEVLHLFRCYTHTHPAGTGSTLKGKRNKKADTNDGPRPKQRRGGKGTNGPPEPTYTARRT